MDTLGSTANIAVNHSVLNGSITNDPPNPSGTDSGWIKIRSHLGNTEGDEDKQMAELLDSKDVVEFKELLIANTIQIDTMYQLLLQKGYFTEAEFFGKLREVQADFQKGGSG